MNIKILGSGCANCKTLQKLTEEVINKMDIQATIEKVEDFPSIMSFGVMSTPALVINDKVKVYGKVPKVDDIKKFIEEEM